MQHAMIQSLRYAKAYRDEYSDDNGDTPNRSRPAGILEMIPQIAALVSTLPQEVLGRRYHHKEPAIQPGSLQVHGEKISGHKLP